MKKKTLVIVAHPNLQESVVNRAWAEAVCGEVTLRNLTELYPSGTSIDVSAEQAVLEQHDRIIFQFPLYWYSAPTILKQWCEDVFTFGWAYGTAHHLEGKELGIAVSCGGKEAEFREGGVQLHPLQTYMTQYEGIAAFIHVAYIGCHAFYDTFNENTPSRLAEDCKRYLAFLQKD